MTESTATLAAVSGRPYGPSKLKLSIGKDITNGNMLTLLFGSFFGIAMMGFVNASQPYLFTEVLNVPLEEQAALAGNLTFLSEIVVILTIGIAGALSDKIGRKPLWAAAFFIFCIGYFLYPLAESVEQLTIFRMFFALSLIHISEPTRPY